MSPSRTGGSQSTTCTGPGDGEEIESLHIINYGHHHIFLECNNMLMAYSPFW